MPNTIEVEIRLHVKDEQEFQKARNSLKHLKSKKMIQIDTYYYPPHKDFLETEQGREFLRIRQPKNELTHKNVIYQNGKKTHSIENNIPLQSTEAMEELLNQLGFREHIVVDKTREQFEDKDFTITFDFLQGIGNFIEIERKGNVTDVEIANNECLDKITSLGITNFKLCENMGYVQMLEKQKQGELNEKDF